VTTKKPPVRAPAGSPAGDLIVTTVDEAHAQATVAAVVRERMTEIGPPMSWNKARELIRTGRVRVDRSPCHDPAQRLASGALVEINPTGKRRLAPILEPERLVYVDAELVVVDKPAGLVSVPLDERDERDSLIERTRVALSEHDQEHARTSAGKDRLGVVQRLDKDSTGLLVFARTRRSRKVLESQFRAHTVERRYVALVHGRAEAMVHDSFLLGDRGDGLRGSWRGTTPPPALAKRSITKVRVEQRLRGPSGELTLISCQIETGRQHQIRIHLAEAGNRLVGETLYGLGGSGTGRHERERPDPLAALGVTRPMLHSASLGFRHPVHDRPLRFESPLPADFRAVLERLATSAV
jgi:23S rRNA pseudouridine1911/1915/1917 synthase